MAAECVDDDFFETFCEFVAELVRSNFDPPVVEEREAVICVCWLRLLDRRLALDEGERHYVDLLAFDSLVCLNHSLAYSLALNQKSAKFAEACYFVGEQHSRIDIEELNEEAKHSCNPLLPDFVQKVEFEERQGLPHFAIVDLDLLLVNLHL